jgi:hypothetical protein
MTKREAVRALRQLCTSRESIRGKDGNYHGADEVLAVLLRSFSRPTKLEREAAPWMRLSADTGLLKTTRSAAGRWLAAYNRKAER